MNRDLTKPWYASRSLWGGVAAVISGVGLMLGIEFGVAEQEALTTALLNIGTIVGGIVAVWGRVRAEKRIGK